MSIYFVNNNFKQSLLVKSIDIYIPMSIMRVSNKYTVPLTRGYSEDFLKDAPDTQYIRFLDQGLLEIQINYFTKELIALTAVSIKKMVINDCLWKTSLPVLERTIALTSSVLTKHYDTYTPYDIHSDCEVELYSNALVFKIPRASKSCYFIYEQGSLGVFTDHNFMINAFVVFDLDKKEVIELVKYAQSNTDYISQDYCSNRVTSFLKCNLLMDNTQVLINKLFELKNVNIWHVLYYGLHRFLIDTAFCVKYAEEYLMRFNEASTFVVELAGLVPSEYDQVYVIFEKLVADKNIIMIENEQIFNKIWFYLHLSVDMYTLKLI